MELGKPVSPMKHHNHKGTKKATPWQNRMRNTFVSENIRRFNNDRVHISSGTVGKHLSTFGFKACLFRGRTGGEGGQDKIFDPTQVLLPVKVWLLSSGLQNYACQLAMDELTVTSRKYNFSLSTNT
jgi:hypothetical protein